MPSSRHRWWHLQKKVSIRSYAEELFEALDSPVSLGAYLRLKHGEFDQLAEMSIDPLDYACPADFFIDYQAVKAVSKLESLPTTFDRRGNAIKKFLEAEEQCAQTNARFESRSRGDYQFPPSVNSVLLRTSRKITSILGDVPEYSELNFRFGPGAAYGVRGETSVYNKVISGLECTSAMLPILGEFLTEFPGWIPAGDQHVDLVQGSELTFVPKSAKIHRPICIEPLLNGLYQKGVGDYMRKRLRRWGVNLNDQTVNQKLAAYAGTRSLCTIDFSSASDTIAYMLVLDLLPLPWFEFLDVARCPQFEIEGCSYYFNKFTSMGNAYTFELETLIFFAIAVSCCEQLGVEYDVGETLHVYGDDVIIPRAAYDLFHEVCSQVGFSVNVEKSFTEGPFYESCGEDYFMGTFVRPILFKKEVKSVEDLFYVTNATLTIQGRLEALMGTQASPRHVRVARRLASLHAWCLRRIPKRLRFPVPYGSGDGGVVADFDVSAPRRAPKGWDGYRYRSVRRQPVKMRPPEGEFPMAYALYHAGLSAGLTNGTDCPLSLNFFRDLPSSDDKGEGYTVRNRTRPYVSKNIWFGSWPLAPARWGDEALRLCIRRM